jgi:hypothetical protein
LSTTSNVLRVHLEAERGSPRRVEAAPLRGGRCQKPGAGSMLTSVPVRCGWCGSPANRWRRSPGTSGSTRARWELGRPGAPLRPVQARVHSRLVRGGGAFPAGAVGQVYLDDETGRPEWVSVNTGMFGLNESLVPLQDASLAGDRLDVAYDKETVKAAPRVEVDSHLEPNEEDELYLPGDRPRKRSAPRSSLPAVPAAPSWRGRPDWKAALNAFAAANSTGVRKFSIRGGRRSGFRPAAPVRGVRVLSWWRIVVPFWALLCDVGVRPSQGRVPRVAPGSSGQVPCVERRCGGR